MKLSMKMPIFVALLVMFATISVGVTATMLAQSALRESGEQKLEALLDARGHELKLYLDSIKEDITLLSGAEDTRDAFMKFMISFGGLGGAPEAERLYMNENPHKDDLSKLVDAGDGSGYSKTHKRYHEWFKNYAVTRGYYDIFFISAGGDVVYTYTKEPDFASNLAEGPWKDSGLARVWKTINEGRGKVKYAFDDFTPYGPSKDAAASFIAVPIEAQGMYIGVLALQMPVGRINGVMQSAAGLGETGETYIVGQDFKMRSDSRFVKSGETSILKTEVKTDTVKAGLSGETGVREIEDYRGIEVVSAYKPLVFEGVKWTLIGEINADEMFADVTYTRNMIILIGLLITATGIALSYFGAKSITTPLAGLSQVMGVMGEGMYDVDVPATTRVDELGDMAKAADGFRLKLIEGRKLEEQQKAAQSEQIARAEKMGDAISAFERTIVDVVGTVSAASTELQSTSQSLSSTAEQTSDRSTAVAAASEELTQNVQTVASATEELTSSIHEISSQIAESTNIIDHAVTQAGDANDRVKNLSEAAQKIGEVVTLINEIASQTNLLALNATIEAARAGDAGKGFAVVASEVKGLATQTGKATEEIASQIASMQASTDSTAKSILTISETIGRVNDISTSIAAAIEEQGSATQEISRNVQEASSGTNEVSSNVVTVKESSQETSAGASQVLSASSELAQSGDRLKQEVDSFLNTIRDL